jgi:drug/metabolite transporter (DMT)-like permease
VILFGFTDFFTVTATHGWTHNSFLSAFFLGVTATGIALILFNVLLKTASPVFASSVTYLIPIVALCWGILDGESLQHIQIVGVAVILGGVFLVK